MATSEGCMDLFEHLDRLGYSTRAFGSDLRLAASEWAEFLGPAVSDVDLIPACDRYLASDKATRFGPVVMPKAPDVLAWARKTGRKKEWTESFGVSRRDQRWFARIRYGSEAAPGYPHPRIHQCCAEGHAVGANATRCAFNLPRSIDVDGEVLDASASMMRLIGSESIPPMSPPDATQEDLF